MAEKKEDRRIRRTKRLLRQALAELMNEKDFRDITVKEIAERADLNRGTFYFHYTDTFDLKDKVENELVEVFTEYMEAYQPTDGDHSVYQLAGGILSYMDENRFIVRTLFRDKSGESLRTKFTAALEVLIERVQIDHVKEETEQERAYIGRFLANGIIGDISMWLEKDDGTTVEEITAIINELVNRVFPV